MRRPNWKARFAARRLRKLVPKIEADLRRMRRDQREMESRQKLHGGYALDLDRHLGRTERKEARLGRAIEALRRFDKASMSDG